MTIKKPILIITAIILVIIIIVLGFLVFKKANIPAFNFKDTDLERVKIDDSFYVDISPTVAFENGQGIIDISMVNQGDKNTITVMAQIPEGLNLKIRSREFSSENFDEVITLGQYNLNFNEQVEFAINVNGSVENGASLVLYFNDYKQTIVLVSQGAGESAVDHEPQTYYVAKNGDDNNVGSAESPWLTISSAASKALAGDTVFIKAGTYEETVTPQNSGLSGKIITFTNYEDDEVIIQAQEGYGFYLGYGVNYIKIDNLTITRSIGAGTITNYPKTASIAHGAGVKISASNYNIISNNTFYDNDIGVFVSQGAPFGIDGERITPIYNQISNNTIYNSGEAGIRIKRSDYTTADGNKVYHNGYPTNPVYNEPAAGITYYCTIGTTISNNTVYDNSGSAVDNYAGTNSEACDSASTVIKNNVLSQTNPTTIEDRFFTGEKIVLIIADIEIEDPTHLYQYNSFYNGEYGSKIVVWGLSNYGEDGESLTFSQYQEKAQTLNPNSGIGDQEVDYNPIE